MTSMNMTAPARVDAPAPPPPAAEWRAAVAPHLDVDPRRAIFQLVTTLGLAVLALVTTYQAIGWSVWLAAALVLPAAGLLVRTFIIMHDCAHGSFLPWRRANDAVGFVTGALTFTPYGQWRREHAIHHAGSGDLDRRGHGDIWTMTVREYLAHTPSARLRYRLVRHPASLLLVGPAYLMVGQRFRPRSKATGTPQLVSVWATNAALVLGSALVVWAWGWAALLVYYLAVYFAGMAGIWLFYVQHQFEDAYWESHGEWDYATAALRGSTYLRLPKLLQWFTGSIGLHHVHHLAPKIPNYRLQQCHDANPALMGRVPVITMRDGMAAMRLALWDEAQHRLVRFADIKHLDRPADATAATAAAAETDRSTSTSTSTSTRTTTLEPGT